MMIMPGSRRIRQKEREITEGKRGAEGIHTVGLQRDRKICHDDGKHWVRWTGRQDTPLGVSQLGKGG